MSSNGKAKEHSSSLMERRVPRVPILGPGSYFSAAILGATTRFVEICGIPHLDAKNASRYGAPRIC